MSDSFLQTFLYHLEAVSSWGDRITNAKTPEALNKAQAGLARATGKMSREVPPQMNTHLLEQFHASYRSAGGVGKIDKKYIDKAYYNRKKAMAGVKKSATAMKSWGNELAQQKGLSEQQAEYEKIIRRRQTHNDVPIEKYLKAKRGLETIKQARNNNPQKVGTEPTVFYYRKESKDFAARVRMPADHYFKMLSETATKTARNIGTIAAAKSGWVIVHDGHGCGKKGHKSGAAVDGEVWPVEEAMKYPLSHPHCQRSFTTAEGPPGSKKLKEQMKSMAKAVTEALDKVNFDSLETVAKVATGVGMVGSVYGTVVTNPFVKRFMREVIEDSNIRMYDFLERELIRITSYAKKEAAAFAEYGDGLKAVSQEDFNAKVLKSFDDDLANADFLRKGQKEIVDISLAQAKTLGVPVRLPKQQLMETLEDYGDWVIHRDFQAKSLADKLVDHRIMSEANEQLWGEEAAIKFHVSQGAGFNMNKNWYNIMQKLKETYAKNPDKADRELVRLMAGVVDPSPWLKVNLPGDFKFSVGMTTNGRMDLAEKIFVKGGANMHLSVQEIKWAEQLGMDLEELGTTLLSKQDIIKALQPRISYQPGGLFNASVALKNAKIQPIIRLYPPGTLNRFIHLDAKLRAGSIEDFIKDLRKIDRGQQNSVKDALENLIKYPMKAYERKKLKLPNESLADIIGRQADVKTYELFKNLLSEDLITTVNFFRNSPLVMRYRMVGASPSSFSVSALPGNNYLRYSYRFMLDGGPEYRKTMTFILKNMEKGLTADQALALAVQKGMPISKFQAATQGWMTGSSFLPNFGGGFSIHGLNIDQKELLAKLGIWKGSLLKVSKETRYGYDVLLEWKAEAKGLAHTIESGLGDMNVRGINTLNDLVDQVGRVFGKERRLNLVDSIYEPSRKVDLSFADSVMHKNPALKEDLERFAQSWEAKFPDRAIPKIIIDDTIKNPMETIRGVIHMRSDAVDDWEVLGGLRRRLVRTGYFPRDASDPVATLMHEAAHSLMYNMTDVEKKWILEAALKSSPWPPSHGVQSGQIAKADLKFIRNWMKDPVIQKRIAYRVSSYGSTSVEEMIAEALSEYFTSKRPRAIAKSVGDKFVDIAIDSPKAGKNGSVLPSGFKFWDQEVDSEASIMGRLSTMHTEWSAREAEILARRYPAHYTQGQIDVLDRAMQAGSALHDYGKDSAFSGLKMEEELFQIHSKFRHHIEQSYLKFKNDHPNLEYPTVRIGKLTKQGVGTTNTYQAWVQFAGDHDLYLGENMLHNYNDAREMRSLLTAVGFHPEGTGSIDALLTHELGHYLHFNMTTFQVRDIIEYFMLDTPDHKNFLGRLRNLSKSDPEEMSFFYYDEFTTFRESLNDFLRNLPEDIHSLSKAEFTALVQRYTDSNMSQEVGRGVDPAVLSTYGTTNFYELIAELMSFSQTPEAMGSPFMRGFKEVISGMAGDISRDNNGAWGAPPIRSFDNRMSSGRSVFDAVKKVADLSGRY